MSPRWAGPGLLALLSGCWLERVTGVAVPLDPAYTANAKDDDGGGSNVPFAGHSGPTVTVSGTVGGEQALTATPVDLTIQVPDPKAAGGMRSEGKLMLDGPGAFSLKVPVDAGALSIQAFQDPDTDGPNGTDPYVDLSVQVASVDISGLELILIAGGRGTAAGHTDAAPGAPGGAPRQADAPPGAPGGDPNGPQHQNVPGGAVPHGEGVPVGPPPMGRGAPGAMPPFAELGEAPVTLKVTLACADCKTIDLDLFVEDPSRPGGRRHIGKLKEEPGLVEIKAPRGYGKIVLEAFSDLDANGPSKGDPMGIYLGNPLVIGAEDPPPITIELQVQPGGAMPRIAVRPGAPGPGGLPPTPPPLLPPTPPR
jgi:hypothetical protein